MISKRNLTALVAVVAVLVAISVMQKLSHRRTTSRAATTVLIDGEQKADALGKLVFGRGREAEAVVLESGPDGWSVRTAWGARAGEERISALLTSLGNLVGEYRSDRPEVLADYGLGADDAVTIRAFGKDGQPAFALLVGARPQGGAGNFVRLPDRNEVYLTQAGVLGQLGIYGEPQTPTSRFFVDLQAVKEDRQAVERIGLHDHDGARELVKVFSAPADAATDSAAAAAIRATWEWKLEGGGRSQPLAKTKVDAVLNSLVSVRASDLDDPNAPPATYGLDNPARVATLALADGREVVLEFGADRPAAGDQPAGTWMRVRGRPAVWVVSEYTIKNVFKPTGELKPD